jgi:L-lysine 2,3-aminomutase (EC 5.4.3.2)
MALAIENKIPFGITPYYLSLMDYEASRKWDYQVRSQVIPPMYYVENMMKHRNDREYAFDFMGEHDTSPHDLVTRRYVTIAIMKPYNSCPQICVYCQRNWEVEEAMSPKAEYSKRL